MFTAGRKPHLEAQCSQNGVSKSIQGFTAQGTFPISGLFVGLGFLNYFLFPVSFTGLTGI